MPDLARCRDCAAVTLDTDDDVRRHRAWHRDLTAKQEGTRRVANAATSALGGLRGQIEHYEQLLQEQPIPIEPEQTHVRDMPDDDELDLEPATDPGGDDETPAPTGRLTDVDYFTAQPFGRDDLA